MKSGKRPNFVVMVAGHHPNFRKRWAQGLQESAAVHVVDGEKDLQESLADIHPSVLLLDLATRGAGGIGGLMTLQQVSPGTKIVALSKLPTAEEAIAAVKAGAKGYGGNDISTNMLRKVVASIQDGQIWIARELVSSLIHELALLTAQQSQTAREASNGALNHLSQMEREVASLVGGGTSDKDIAARLDLTEKAVKAHLSSILSKLEVPNRFRLALLMNSQAERSREDKRGAHDDQISRRRAEYSIRPMATGRSAGNGHSV